MTESLHVTGGETISLLLRLTEDKERLREALEAIVDVVPKTRTTRSGPVERVVQWAEALDKAQRIARDALDELETA